MIGGEKMNNIETVKIMMLKGDKGDVGNPTDEQILTQVDRYLKSNPSATIDENIIRAAVSDWLNAHPEAAMDEATVRAIATEVSNAAVSVVSGRVDTVEQTLAEQAEKISDKVGHSELDDRLKNAAIEYIGGATLYVNADATSEQVATGNYYRSLQDCFAALNNRMLYNDVTINIASNCTGASIIKGLHGVGNVTINGNGNTLSGKLTIDGISGLQIKINNFEVVGNGNDAAVYVRAAHSVIFEECTVNGNGSNLAAFVVGFDSHIQLIGCGLYNATCLINAESAAYLYFRDLKGSGTEFIRTAYGAFVVGSGTRPSGTVTRIGALTDPADLSTLTVDSGTSTPTVDTPTTVNYIAMATDTYSPSNQNWNYGQHNDIVQGFVNNYGRLRGCMWFDNGTIRSVLNDKTIKQSSLRLSMYSGVGRGVGVSIELYGTSLSSASGTPELTKYYGTIGTTEPGETTEITLPTSVISDLAAGTINGLVLCSDDTAAYKTNAWSKNYARFYGESTGDSSTKPQLTIQYQ